MKQQTHLVTTRATVKNVQLVDDDGANIDEKISMAYQERVERFRCCDQRMRWFLTVKVGMVAGAPVDLETDSSKGLLEPAFLIVDQGSRRTDEQ